MATVVVFGGGGFLGRRLVDRLTAEGMTVRVAVRHPDPARIELRSTGFERVTVVSTDVRDQASVAAAIAEADAVVNAVSAYVEKGGVTFDAVHVRGLPFDKSGRCDSRPSDREASATAGSQARRPSALKLAAFHRHLLCGAHADNAGSPRRKIQGHAFCEWSTIIHPHNDGFSGSWVTDHETSAEG